MKDQIRTFKDLQAKQDRLKLQAEVSKQLFFESFGNTRRSTGDFLLKGVLLPAGAAGLAAWSAKKVFGNNSTGNESNDFAAGNGASGFFSSLLPKLMPIGLSLFNAYLTKEFVKKEVEEI